MPLTATRWSSGRRSSRPTATTASPAALREANIYERQRYRHLLGIPLVESASDTAALARTPFIVVRIMGTGQTEVFATGVYRDRFVRQDGRLLLAERVAICDSTVTDTLMALPL